MQVGRNEGPGARPQLTKPPVGDQEHPAVTAEALGDRVRVQAASPLSEAERLAVLKAAVDATRQPVLVPAAPVPTPSPPEASRIQGGGGKTAYRPPDVVRLPYSGGAPALDVEQMDPAIINTNLELKTLYSLQKKAPWALRGYQIFSKVLGPLGAIANLGYTSFNMRRILLDPKAPTFLKGGIVAATGLAGVSTAAAIRVGLHAWKLWPMAAQGAALVGKIAGVGGLGAGAVLSAMDTFNTFRDPAASPAARAVSLLGTVAAFALPIAVLLGAAGPVGFGLGVLAVALPFLKGPLGKVPILNRFFGSIGHLFG